MSRTTRALKRLGVPGLAAVTMVAGLPLFLGTASAAHITSLTLEPPTASAAAGSCELFTARLKFASAAQAASETVDVVITEDADPVAAGSQASATMDADFCTAPTGTTTPGTPADTTDSGAAGTSDRAEFTANVDAGDPDADGINGNTATATFGVTSNQPGAVDIRAFYETTDNDSFDAGEFTDTSVLTVTAGGPAGSNANQDAAADVEVLSGADTPATGTNNDATTAIEGETRTFRVYVSNAVGDPLAGVTVSRTVDSDVNTADQGPATFGVTNNDGIATGTVNFPARNGGTTDNVNFFVNQTDGTTGNDDDPGVPPSGTDAIEPNDYSVVTITQDTNQTNRTVVLSCLTGEASAAGANGQDATPTGTTAVNTETPCVNGARDGDRLFRAVVNAADTEPDTAGTLLSFSVTGGSGDETVTPQEATTTGPFAGPTADPNDSSVDVEVFDPTPTVGQVLTITATVRGTTASDTETLTFRNEASDARNISLTPESATTTPNTARTFSATVVDVDGKPVQGVLVDFTETGAGAFRNGSSSTQATTNASGVATVEVIALPGETGSQTITAAINAPGGTQCGQAAGTGTDPQGNDLTAVGNPGTEPAGNCSDTSTNVFANEPSPSPTSASPTTSPTGSPNCATTPTVTLEFGTINATGSSGVTVTAPANSQIQLLAYSQPSTTYRVVRQATIDNTGTPAQFRITPPTNTRLYAQIVGCTTNPTTASKVLNVRTTLSLNVTRTGVRAYRFFGDSLPARPGGLIVSLYRVTDSGQQILTAQTRANASTGDWVINRVFTGTGRFGFVVRTGQDLQNAPGNSNVRSLLVY